MFTFRILPLLPFILCTTGAQAAYWQGVQRVIPRSPAGNPCAISAHNCYDDRLPGAAGNLASTLKKIHAAQAAGADLIELDIKLEQGVIRVDHEDDGKQNGARFDAVIADPSLKAGDQLLYIEIKEKQPGPAFARMILDDLKRNGYARPGRPVVLRTFSTLRQHLLDLRALLAEPGYAELQVRLQELFPREQKPDLPGFLKQIDQAADSGFHGVEFRYDDHNLLHKLAHARARGLGTNLFTIPHRLGEVFVASLREETDALTVDYPVDRARGVVEEQNQLLYFRTGPEGELPRYWRNGVSHPLVASKTGPRFAQGWVFKAAAQQALRLHDADNRPGEGYLVSAVLRFDELALPEGATMVMLSKADAGGFALELHHPPGQPGTQLRFGVRVGAQYHYATLPASRLNLREHWFVTGAYDGDGGVWLWINQKHDGVTLGRTSGEVVRNDSPVTVGADPQGAEACRYYFSGTIHAFQVLSWGAH